MFQANAFGKWGISLIVPVPDYGNAAVAVCCLPPRRADGSFCPGCLRTSAGALLGSPPGVPGIRTGDAHSGRAGGAAKLLVPPSLVTMAINRGQPGRGRAGAGTVVALQCPGSIGSPFSPSWRDGLGFPLEIGARAKRESHCCLAGTAPSSSQQLPVAPSSAQQRPAAPSSCPRGGPGELCRAGPAGARGCRRRFITAGRSAVVGAVGNANMNLQLWIFFLTEADPSGLLFITCSRRSYCSYSKSFYNDLSL